MTLPSLACTLEYRCRSGSEIGFHVVFLNANSEKPFSSSSDSAAENGASNLLVDIVERIHGALDPCLVDLRGKSAFRILVDASDAQRRTIQIIKFTNLSHKAPHCIFRLR